jgi:hypothetical protein
MKLYRYKNFIKESKEDIDSICKKYYIINYTINGDGSVDVDGDVLLYDKNLTELPLKFRKVSGIFDCAYNKLTSLEGTPREVGGSFYCYNNQLLSLVGSPREVGGGFYCSKNQLTSLSGISKYISGGIYCQNNQLRDVRGVNENWRGEFLVEDNPINEVFKLFPEKRFDGVIEYLNEYNVIRDGKIVILQALERVFWELDLEVPEIEEIEGYDIQF